MKKEDKLKLIYNALKLLAPNGDYDLDSYDIITWYPNGYVQIFCVNRSIYVESNRNENAIPSEILALFNLRKLSNAETNRVYDTISKDDAAAESIGIPIVKGTLYKATPIDKDLFKTT